MSKKAVLPKEAKFLYKLDRALVEQNLLKVSEGKPFGLWDVIVKNADFTEEVIPPRVVWLVLNSLQEFHKDSPRMLASLGLLFVPQILRALVPNDEAFLNECLEIWNRIKSGMP